MMVASTWNVVELTFKSERRYENPYIDVDVGVVFVSPAGGRKEVLGFWDGGDKWKVRFAPPVAGRWEWRSESSDPDNVGLHGQTGEFQVSPYRGDNPIYDHGFLRVSDNRRGFVYGDGTPFFWLGDTAWSMSAGVALEEWEEYLGFRKAQGYNLVQVNSLPQHDSSIKEYRKPFQMNGAEWDLTRPHVAYFHYLDRLVTMTTEAGLFTAMVVLWFDYVPETNLFWNLKKKAVFTPELAERYARYLAARYGAFGTIWMVTGDSDFETPESMAVYDAAAEAIRQTEPYGALMTAHINGDIHTPVALNEREWLDFHMYQSGHSDRSKERARTCAEVARQYEPIRPVLNSEPMYDGVYFAITSDRKPDRDLIRAIYWYSILGGGNAGLTYGVHGVWSWDRPPLSPTWRELLRYESAQDALRLKGFFATLPWWELEPCHQLLVEGGGAEAAVACTPRREVIVAYVEQAGSLVLNVDMEHQYAGEWFNPRTGEGQSAHLAILERDVTIEAPSWQGDAALLLQLTT